MVSPFYETHGGGLERVAGHLCRELMLQGEKLLWAASSDDALLNNDIEMLPLRCINPLERFTGLPTPLPGLRAIPQLIRAIRRSDAVIIHDALYAISILAMVIARMLGKRTVLIQHIAAIPFSSRLLRHLMALANRLVTRPMLRAANARVFISDTVRHDLLGTPARYPYQLIFNGVDRTTFFFRGTAVKKTILPADIAVPTGMRPVLFVGRYVEKKGLAILRTLAETRPDLFFLLAGQGPLSPDDWGLSNVYDLGIQSPAALADLYHQVDLLLLPSVGEGYPLVIQEAMACGLPVICGIPTHRADPQAARWLCGVDIDLANPQASAHLCANAIDSMALSESERTEMAHYATTHYCWQIMASKVLALGMPPDAIISSNA
ncbi:glycosyltransferase family 4 protein [Cedecea sp.]|jgi:glycosyltransferase involved in cell wall biosynthesis|uniref:glycosyltransferase family 4 protein n=1 Tax=Cedecea sp. TaxID=1970739 RepID=UPI0012AD5D0B|nr:glycosyltransferase [Enterobacteriaceae bacterium RIT693]